jgi:hypothetical protein
MTKTAVAFHMTCDAIFKSSPKVYFWTVTFSELHSDWIRAALFRRFLWDLRRKIGKGWGGVRVCELHKEHGVHYHLLVTARLAVDLVRTIGRCHGIGRVHVCIARPESASYMAKYLRKQKDGPKTEAGRNARRWATFGEVPRTRVRDLVNESPMWVYRRIHDLKFTDYQSEKVLQHCWDRGEMCFHRAWQAINSGNHGDATKLAMGILEKKSRTELVYRQKFDGSDISGGIPF